MSRAHPRRSANALLKARRRPRDIQVHNDFGILQIHALAQEVRRQQKIDPLGGGWERSIVGSWGEAGKSLAPRKAASRDARSVSCEHRNAAESRERAKEHRNGFRVL